MKKLICFFITLLVHYTVHSQIITRGPYLQSVTHESIIVMWRTDVPCPSTVWFGTDTLALNQTVTVPGNVTDHIVELTGLNSSVFYYYAVGNATNILIGATSAFSFKTHPVPGTPVPVRVWAIGDFGRGNTGQAEVRSSYENYTGSRGTDVWLWLGDNAYQEGTDAEYQDHVFNVPGFSSIFTYTPFWPSPGNHDYTSVWSESTLLGIPYTNIPLADHEGPYFDMVEVPKFAEAGGFPSQHEVFYSFDYGDVHFLSLNSEVFDYTFSYDGINQMKDWITLDLAQNTRKFTIAYFHQPPYSKGSHDSDDLYEIVMKAMREKVIPLLESFDIDLIVCGHSHVFERSFLINGHYGNSSSFNASTMLMDGTLGNISQGGAYIKDGSYATPEGTVYVVCGNSGSSESGSALNHPAMAYTDGGSNVMGSFIVDVYKNRLDAKYLKSTGIIGDEFTILKKDLALAILTNEEICEGDTISLSANYTGGSDSLLFVWNPGGLTGENVMVSPTVNTVYTLTVTDQLTGQVEATQVNVNILSLIPVVVSEVIPGTLGVTGLGAGYSFQWLINGNPISGANTAYYTPFFNGSYSLLITAPNGCVYETDAYLFSTTSSIEGLNQESEFSVFPNPSNGTITIKVSEQFAGSTYTIMDVVGKRVYSGMLEQVQNPLDLNGLANGKYFIHISTNSGIKVCSFILSK